MTGEQTNNQHEKLSVDPLYDLGARVQAAAIKAMEDALIRELCPNWPTTLKRGVIVPKDLVADVAALIDKRTIINNLRPRINKLAADAVLRCLRQDIITGINKELTNDPGVRAQLQTVVLDTLRGKSK